MKSSLSWEQDVPPNHQEGEHDEAALLPHEKQKNSPS